MQQIYNQMLVNNLDNEKMCSEFTKTKPRGRFVYFAFHFEVICRYRKIENTPETRSDSFSVARLRGTFFYFISRRFL